MKRLIVALAIVLTLSPSIADAASYICGATARHHFGYPARYKGCNLNLAREWAHCFPRTSAGPGMVVVQSRRGHALGGGPGGHVSVIVRLTESCHAIVKDEKGSYERDICKHLIAYVNPRGGSWSGSPERSTPLG